MRGRCTRLICPLLVVLYVVLVPGTNHARNFRAFTFNIRSGSSDDGMNSWKYRQDDMRTFIMTTKPDVFGVQEAVPEQVKFLSDTLKKEYACIGVGCEDGKSEGEHLTIFYRKKIYKLVNNKTFWLSETPDVPSKGWDATGKRICTWASFQNIKNGKSFIFANTHLDHDGELSRLNSAMLLKQQLGRLDNGIPVIVAGCFNFTDTSPCHSIMCNRIFPLVDTYKKAKSVMGKKSSYHDFGKIPDEEGKRIDFMFVSPNIKVEKVHIFNSLLFGGGFLSDHHPYIVDLSGKVF